MERPQETLPVQPFQRPRRLLVRGRDACLLVVSRPNGRNGGELRQPVTRVAKPYELRAARSSRCERLLRW
jgi:hypothetical protein